MWEFVQSYGLWILFGGFLLLMMRAHGHGRHGGGCGMGGGGHSRHSADEEGPITEPESEDSLSGGHRREN